MLFVPFVFLAVEFGCEYVDKLKLMLHLLSRNFRLEWFVDMVRKRVEKRQGGTEDVCREGQM